MTRPKPREWQPGDVVASGDLRGFLTDRDEKSRVVWPDGSSNDLGIVSVRPLVVIDPEKVAGTTDGATYIARLLREADENNGIPTFAALADEFDPPVPKPEEPIGLGAVVVDKIGEKWVRVYAGRDFAPAWEQEGSGGNRDHYRHIAVADVLSEGVPA